MSMPCSIACFVILHVLWCQLAYLNQQAQVSMLDTDITLERDSYNGRQCTMLQMLKCKTRCVAQICSPSWKRLTPMLCCIQELQHIVLLNPARGNFTQAILLQTCKQLVYIMIYMVHDSIRWLLQGSIDADSQLGQLSQDLSVRVKIQ